MKKLKFTMRKWRKKWISCMVGAVFVSWNNPEFYHVEHLLLIIYSLFSPSLISAIIQELQEECKVLQRYLDSANEEIQVLVWKKGCTNV